MIVAVRPAKGRRRFLPIPPSWTARRPLRAPNDPSFWDHVGDVISQIPDVTQTWLPVFFLLLMIVIVWLLWRTMQLMPKIKPARQDAQGKSSIRWEDVAGLPEAKAELQEVVDFLRHPERFERLGARVPRGILLYGPPGTGKTLLAKAVAHESGAKFFSQSASAFVEMFAGLGAARIRKLFDDARKNAPVDHLHRRARRRRNRAHRRRLQPRAGPDARTSCSSSSTGSARPRRSS